MMVAAIYMWLCGRNARRFHAEGRQHAEGGR